jgi:hypothetical protein
MELKTEQPQKGQTLTLELINDPVEKKNQDRINSFHSLNNKSFDIYGVTMTNGNWFKSNYPPQNSHQKQNKYWQTK